MEQHPTRCTRCQSDDIEIDYRDFYVEAYRINYVCNKCGWTYHADPIDPPDVGEFEDKNSEPAPYRYEAEDERLFDDGSYGIE